MVGGIFYSTAYSASWGSGLFVRATPHATQRSVRACVLPRAGLAFIAKPHPHVVAPWPLCSQVVLARLPSKRKETFKKKSAYRDADIEER